MCHQHKNLQVAYAVSKTKERPSMSLCTPPLHMSCEDVHTDHMEKRTRVVEVSNPGQVEYSSGHRKFQILYCIAKH